MVPGGCAAQGAARAWRWLAQEVAWLGCLYTQWPTVRETRAGHAVEMERAWARVLGDSEHWQHLGEWRDFVWVTLNGVWSWKGVSIDLLKFLMELQKSFKDTAARLGQQTMKAREDKLKERLAE